MTHVAHFYVANSDKVNENAPNIRKVDKSNFRKQKLPEQLP